MVTKPPIVTLDSAQDLKRIAIALEVWLSMQSRGPELEYPVSKLAGFSWESIGAEVIEADDRGAVVVRWMFHTWRRLEAGQDLIFQRAVSQTQRSILAVFNGSPLFEPTTKQPEQPHE